MNRVTVHPNLLTWARKRAGLSVDKALEFFPKFTEWLSGQSAPTMRQLEEFASKTHTPLGYLFLTEPPEDKLPIPDFRTLTNNTPRQPSPNLLETVQTLQLRQAWIRNYLMEEGEKPLPFVGSITIRDNPADAAAKMRDYMKLSENWAANEKNSEDAFRLLRRKIEDSGVFLSINGIVGNNTTRALSTDEFRGFTLSDNYAPFIFINNNDAKAAQMFTLAHELTHVWLGEGGVSNPGPESAVARATHGTERFCNETAAEFLVPQTAFLAAWERAKNASDPIGDAAHVFKVSGIVAARRALELRLIGRDQFSSYYNLCMNNWKAMQSKRGIRGGGGNFWATNNGRLGERFGSTVVRAVKSGRLRFSEACELTGLHGSTFDRYVEKITPLKH